MSLDEVSISEIIREILIIYDPKKYFENAWNNHYNTLDYHSYRVCMKLNVDMNSFPFPEDEFQEGSDE